ncbi:MAG: hypothetical protein ACE5HT_03085 [Gemmatimonadales bacterium]
MGEDSLKSAGDIKRLRDEKVKLEGWLARLSDAGNETPDNVRSKVEGDYRERLGQVVAELQSHSAEIRAVLDKQREVRAGIAEEETGATEKLAEAGLRHSVGEYDKKEWTKIESEINATLQELRGKLAGVDSEIQELEELMAIVSEPETAGQVSRESMGVKAGGDGVDEVDEVSVAARPEESVGGAAGEPAAASQHDAFDGLDFLRSVTEDEGHGPAAARASGETVQPVEALEQGPDLGEPKPEPAPAPAPEPVPKAPRVSKSVGAEGVTSFADTTGQPKKAQAKTLKCAECGTLNLPTEWYCERCGAELSVL